MNWNGRRQRWSGWTLLLLFALAGAMLLAWYGRREASVAADAPVSETEEPVEDGGRKLIALTFDDGPRRSTTTALLDGLAERGVKATFFLIGAQVEDNRDVVRRMDREGHQIGIHTFDHVQLTELNRADFDAQVEKTRSILRATLEHNDFLLRPPYGILDDSVKAWAGCPIILWSIDPEDWRDQDTGRVTEEVVTEARDGGIILMHDIFPESVEAALAIVDALHTQGYYFCTIEELFAARGISLEAGESYWNAYP
ncbi:polysaccharide deacetylase family protein [uncultured Flavonifractor sp.]|uniref:polysaccharide deacetylase family protein n=1 Tax=uncultured Flavonifractor sp. TaxID=1193534 RepID=UPI0026251012|nr:polysaccharide deacetylase family protein [uncultured Flavonifractor sp.]